MASNHLKSDPNSKGQPGHAIQTVAPTPADPCQITPIYADRYHSNVPAPQAWRVKTRYVAGETIRSISRSEHLNRRTVTTIVRGQDVQNHVAALRERFYGLGCAALDAVEHALTVQKDARLGFEILKSIGVVPSVKEGVEPQNQEPMSDQDARVRGIMVKMAAIAVERNRVFGTPSPDIDAVEKQIEDELRRQKQEKQ